MSQTRREILKKGTIAASTLGLTPLMRGFAQGKKIRIGFIPLTDAAPIIMAGELGLYKKYGVDVEVVKEASWATTRDHLLNGELHAAHCLFGMPFSVYSGIGGPAGKVMPIAMILNNNGQGITLAKQDFGGKVGFKDLEGAGKAIMAKKKDGKELTFAMTFPGGTHDIWLRYWLGACGVNPNDDVKVITIPPPQMVANMSVGNMDGYCVGEPWNGMAVKQDIGFTHAASQDIWSQHPEKALVMNNEFFNGEQEAAKAITKAILEACKWLDVPKNRREAAKVLGQRQYLNANADVIDARLSGNYDLGGGLGKKVYTTNNMMFHRGGLTNYPRSSYGYFFLAQYVRWGMIKSAEYKEATSAILKQSFYKEVAAEMKVKIPTDDMKPLKGLIDGVVFDPKKPEAAIKAYKVKAG